MGKINEFLVRVKKSEFVRNVATLATGTTLAQGVSLISAPILYRIYSRVDYGTLGLYMAIVGVIGVFSTMQYLQPILLEKEDDDAKRIMWLNRSINTVVTVIIAVLVFFLGDYVAQMLNNESVTKWLYLVPISIFFSGQNQIFRVWANRKKRYKLMSINSILMAVLVPAVSISVGLIHEGPLGLFLGLLTSQIIPTIFLLVILTRNDDLGLKYFVLKDIKTKAKQYSNFPMFSLPSEFIYTFTYQLPVFMLSTFAGAAVVGVYTLCVRMLGLPVQLIGSAIGEVYRQKSTQDYNETGSFNTIFVKTFKTLALISVVPLLVILFLGPTIFEFVFGENWRQSGVIAQLLIFMFMLQMIVSPLSYAYIIKNKLKEDAFLHVLILITNLLIFYIGFHFFDNHLIVLFIFGLNYSVFYLIYLLRSYKLSKNTSPL